jgi:hypothetical protein
MPKREQFEKLVWLASGALLRIREWKYIYPVAGIEPVGTGDIRLTG